jgi:flagellar hook-associated protein 3 FlgL
VSTRITTGMVQRHVLADLNDVSNRIANTQRKLSSNREIERPSDDPFGASRALALRDSLAGVQQHQRNVEDAQGWMEASELALTTITDAVHRARELVTRGGNDTVDPVSREAIASEIDELVDLVKSSANATFKNQYLFSGTQTATEPYPAATDAYQGNGASIARELGPGVAVGINVDITAALGNGPTAGDDKLLDVLRDVATHLRTGDNDALRSSDITRLQANLDKLLEVRAANGARGNRLELALTRLQDLEGSVTSQLSNTEDADMGKTIIDLNSQQSAYQAALKAGATLVQASLMDFLR